MVRCNVGGRVEGVFCHVMTCPLFGYVSCLCKRVVVGLGTNWKQNEACLFCFSSAHTTGTIAHVDLFQLSIASAR